MLEAAERLGIEILFIPLFLTQEEGKEQQKGLKEYLDSIPAECYDSNLTIRES